MYASHLGEYLGIPATGKKATHRVMDWWTRTGDRLFENGAFIDIIHLSLQMGVDPFETMAGQVESK